VCAEAGRHARTLTLNGGALEHSPLLWAMSRSPSSTSVCLERLRKRFVGSLSAGGPPCVPDPAPYRRPSYLTHALVRGRLLVLPPTGRAAQGRGVRAPTTTTRRA
jgi:hypothetical protein